MNTEEGMQNSMSDNLDRGVCKKLDVDDVDPINVRVPDIKKDKDDPIVEVVDDYDYIRNQAIKNIATCDAILTHTLKTMTCELSPRHIESCSGLIDTSMKCSKSLIEIHEKLRKLRTPTVKNENENDDESDTGKKVVGNIKEVIKKYHEELNK